MIAIGELLWSTRFRGLQTGRARRSVVLVGRRPVALPKRLDMARPDQPAPDVINDRGIRLEEGLFEVIQTGIIQVERALEGAIRATAHALKYCDGLCQDLLECHRCPSRGLDACRVPPSVAY